MIKKINQLNPTELEQISHIWLEGNKTAHDFIPNKYWDENFDAVKNQLTVADIYVAYDNQKIIGFMGMQNDYVQGIFIQDAFKHMGFGKALIEQAKGSNKKIKLSVYKKNQRAIEFYLAQGFIKDSEQIDEKTGESEIEMTWSK